MIAWYSKFKFAPGKGIQNIPGFWNIPGTGLQSLTLELRFWTPKPNILDSKSKTFPDSSFHK